MSGKLRTGADCFTYYSVGTTYENPTWTLCPLIRNESVSPSKGRAEFSSRRSRFKRKKGTLIEVPATFTVEYAKGDAFMLALIDSALNGTVIDFAFMFDDITVAGSEGIRMPIEVFDFPFNRDLEDGVTFECEVELTEQLKVDDSLVDMEWYTVPSSP